MLYLASQWGREWGHEPMLLCVERQRQQPAELPCPGERHRAEQKQHSVLSDMNLMNCDFNTSFR